MIDFITIVVQSELSPKKLSVTRVQFFNTLYSPKSHLVPSFISPCHHYLKGIIAVCFILLLMMYQPHVFAAPDAGSILQEQRELEQPEKFNENYIKNPGTDDEPKKHKPSEVKVTVKEFILEGEITIFKKEYLLTLIKSYLGKSLTVDELYESLEIIDNAYKKKGYFVVKVFFPKQDVSEGTIIIKIIEGKVDDSENGISLAGEYQRTKKDYVLQIVKKALKSGSVIKKENLERAALILSDMPGITASTNLQPGLKENSTRVIVEVEEGKRYNTNVAVNNLGNRYTGTYKAVAGIDVRGISGYGDELKATYKNTFGAGDLKYLSLQYSSAILYSGLRGGVKSYRLKYRLGEEFESLNLKGSANNYSIYVNYPIYRTVRTNLSVNGTYDFINLEDKSNGIVVSKKSLKVFRTSISGNHSDELLKGGYSSANLVLSLGSNDIKNEDSLAQDQSITGVKSNGSFSKVSFSAFRIQKGSHRFFLLASVLGQYASSNLDSSEKLQLGGANGVRAYSSGEGSGDHGVRATLEGSYLVARKNRLGEVRVIGFYDWGRVRQYKDSYFIPLNTPLSYNLSGWGGGLKFSKADNFDAYLTVARKMGANPGADPITGNDSDGTQSKTKIWFSLQVRL